VAVFAEAGKALAKIRDGRLSRDTHATFEAYCAERWGWSKTHSNRLIESAEVVETFTTVNTRPPAPERTARPLATLPKEDTPAA